MSTTTTKRVNGILSQNVTKRAILSFDDVAFQPDAFQNDAFQIGASNTAATRRISGDVSAAVTKRVS